jgi:hypothetical protein
MSGSNLIERAINAFVRIVEAGAASSAVWAILIVCAFGGLSYADDPRIILQMAALLGLIILIDNLFRYRQERDKQRTLDIRSNELLNRQREAIEKLLSEIAELRKIVDQKK